MTKEEYKTYLETDHWQDFSREIRLDRMVCEGCGISRERSRKKYRQDLNVHHKTYKRVGHERKEDVELLCWACHLTRHGMEGWVLLVESMSMPEVPKIFLVCANCEKPTGQYVYNADEVYEVLCWECRA